MVGLFGSLGGAAADHDAVAAVGEVHLLEDARHDARVFFQLVHEQRQHVERGPADVDLAGGVGVAHRDRIVDEHEFHLERLAAGSGPDFAGVGRRRFAG